MKDVLLNFNEGESRIYNEKTSCIRSGSLARLYHVRRGSQGRLDAVTVAVNFIDAAGVGKAAGTITLTETAEGLELETKLNGLPPGEHGFHLHENPSCAPAEEDGKRAAGLAAGGHYDPHATKAHKGPGGGGHLGDLPKLEVDSKGTANVKLKVAGLKLEDVTGKAIMIHEGENRR